MEFTVAVPEAEVTGEISDYEFETALDGALSNFDFVNSDGVVSVVDDLLDEFRVNGGCATNQLFQKAVQLVIEANLAGVSEARLTDDIKEIVKETLQDDSIFDMDDSRNRSIIRRIVKEELDRLLRGEIAAELMFYRLTRSNS